MPEFIGPVFAKTSTNGSFAITENERFGLVLVCKFRHGSGLGPLIPVPERFWHHPFFPFRYRTDQMPDSLAFRHKK